MLGLLGAQQDKNCLPLAKTGRCNFAESLNSISLNFSGNEFFCDFVDIAIGN